MKVCVDFDKCTGLGICESLAPDFFEVNDEGWVVWVGKGNHFTEGIEKKLWGTTTKIGGIVYDIMIGIRPTSHRNDGRRQRWALSRYLLGVKSFRLPNNRTSMHTDV